MKQLRILRGALLIFAIAVLAVQFPAEAEDVGWVSSVEGSWLLKDKAVMQGQAIPGGVRIQLDRTWRKHNPGKPAHILVSLFDGKTLSAADAGERAPAIQVPDSIAPPSSFVKRLMQAASALIFKEPDRFVPTQARTAGGGALSEAVVLLKDNRLRLGPVLRPLAPGKYSLRLRPLKAVPPEAKISRVELPVDWDGAGAIEIDAAGLVVGLYKAVIADAATGDPRGGEAWLLITEADGFEKAAGGFEKAREVAHQIESDGAASDARVFLRASLETLSTGEK